MSSQTQLFTVTATAPIQKRCTSWKNQQKATLPPKYRTLVKCLSEVNEMSASGVIRLAVKEYFDRMPEAERRSLILRAGRNTY